MSEPSFSEFQGRKGLSRKVNYRPKLKYYYAGVVLVQTILVLAAGNLLIGILRGSVTPVHLLDACAYLALVYISPTRDVLRVFLGHYLSTTVTIMSDRVSQDAQNSNREILFKDVKKVEIAGPYSPMPDLCLHLENGQVARFPRWLERCEYLLESLKIFRPELIDQQTFSDFRARVIEFDHVMARLIERSKVMRVAALYFFLPSVFFALGEILNRIEPGGRTLLRSDGLFLFALQVFYSVAAGAAVMMVEEIIFRKKLSRQMQVDPLAVRRDMAYEKKIMDYGNIAVMVAASLVWLGLYLSMVPR